MSYNRGPGGLEEDIDDALVLGREPDRIPDQNRIDFILVQVFPALFSFQWRGQNRSGRYRHNGDRHRQEKRPNSPLAH